MQDHLNLIYREEEREMLPLCIEEGIGVIPWSPLARGRLARPWGETTPRTETDQYGKTLYAQDRSGQPRDQRGGGDIAKARGVKMAQVALAWVLQKQPVTAPIVGVTKLPQLEDAVGALDVTLTPEEIERLEAPYHSTGEKSFR